MAPGQRLPTDAAPRATPTSNALAVPWPMVDQICALPTRTVWETQSPSALDLPSALGTKD